MSLLVTSIILTVILAALIWGAIETSAKAHHQSVAKRKYLLIILSLLCLLINLFGCFDKVGANQVGIIYDEMKGGIQNETYGEGFHAKSIFQTVTKISTSNRTALVNSTGQTIDSVYAQFTISIVYCIEKDNAGKFFRSTNAENISQSQLDSIVKECLQSSTIKMDIYSLLGDKLEECRNDFVEDLKTKIMERYYITLISASFDDIDAGTRVEEIIRTKAEAQQKIEISELEKQQAEIEAKTKAIEAQAEAEVAKIKAQGDADAIEIKAEAEAKRIELEKGAVEKMIKEYCTEFPTITEEQAATIVLKTIYMDKWDGKLPETFVGMSFDELVDAIVGKLSGTGE
jgi:prohibitin 1